MKTDKNIPQSSGFKLPKSYFKDFKINDLENEKRKHKSGFSVPESYFSELEIKIPKEPKTFKLNELQKTIAIAASLLVLLGSLLLGLILKPQADQEVNFSKLNKSDIENYLEEEMFMESDLYVENEEFYLEIHEQNLSENDIIDNMDDSSIEQLIDY